MYYTRNNSARFSLWFLLALALIYAGYELYKERSMPLSVNPQQYKGFYRIINGYQPNVHRVVIDEGTLGSINVEVGKSGWNKYTAYYPNGVIREEGELNISYHDLPPQPVPDQHDILWGKFYAPDGTLSSEIKDRTGEQLLWYPNGQLRWKMKLKEGKRVYFESWGSDGKLISQEGDSDAK